MPPKNGRNYGNSFTYEKKKWTNYLHYVGGVKYPVELADVCTR